LKDAASTNQTIGGYDTQTNQSIMTKKQKPKIIGRLSMIVAPGKKGEIVVREGETGSK
jgi:hypothetical protein